MKVKIIIYCTLLVLFLSLFGCDNKEKKRMDDETIQGSSCVCGVVRNITNDIIRIQLCGNYVCCEYGECYLDIENQYSDIKEGDNVLLYYVGEMRVNKKESVVEANSIEVLYMEGYENDGKFIADMSLGGSIYPEGITKTEAERILVPIKGEPEERFRVIIATTDLTSNETVWSDIIYEVEDWQKEVTVTYDIETMEILSITQ